MKYKAIPIAINRWYPETFKVFRSLIPIPNPIPKIGDIKGEISMAPIITAGEFKSSPSEAINIEHIKSQALAPFISLLLFILIMVPSLSKPFFRSNRL